MSDGLKANHRAAIIATLAANHRVEQAVLFGSRAMGTNTVTSDVDIALFGQQLTLTDQANLVAACEELPMAQSVDLVLHSTIDNPALVEHIRSHGVEWYRRDGGSGVGRRAEQFSKVKALSAPIQTKLEDASARRNWPEHPLESFVDPKRSICYGIVQPGKPQDCGVRIVRVNNFKNGQIDTRNPLRVDPKIEEKYQRSRLQGGELLLTLVGTMGLSAIAPKELRGWNVARAVGVIPLKENVDKRWINFILRSQPSQDFIKTHANTTVQATFNLRDLAQLPIPMPPDNIRLPMSKLLSVLDDKIELNRKTNATLEAMAKALFKSWFVDFDPVRAKAEGRSTGLPDEISALFPDSFEDSELGEIPRGWGVSEIGKIMKITMGQSPPGSTYNETGEGLPFYQGSSDFQFRHPRERVFCSEPSRVAQSMATLMSVRAPVGSLNMADQICCIGRGVAALQSSNGLNSYAYYLMDSLRNMFQSYNSEGTVFGAINKKDLTSLKVLKCELAIAKAFNDIVTSIDGRISLSVNESKTLASLRDSLLPRLISGKLRVVADEKLAWRAA